MNSLKIYILILLPVILFSQSNLDITGRVSMRVQNIEYDENSNIKPDSISSDDYGKSTLIPGLQQSINLSLFGRMQNFDFTLLSDLKNNDWNKLDFGDINSVDRFSLNLRLSNHELILGDFYQSGNERLMQSREIRGLKYSTRIDEALGQNTFIYIDGLAGQTQKAIEVNDKLQSIYKQFETSGQYSRFLSAGNIKIGKLNIIKV